MIRFNGEERGDLTGRSLMTVLEQEGYRLDRIAVEYNDEILSREAWEGVLLKAGDSLEVVSFVGGG